MFKWKGCGRKRSWPNLRHLHLSWESKESNPWSPYYEALRLDFKILFNLFLLLIHSYDSHNFTYSAVVWRRSLRFSPDWVRHSDAQLNINITFDWCCTSGCRYGTRQICARYFSGTPPSRNLAHGWRRSFIRSLERKREMSREAELLSKYFW
jgi:hypothetical protein